MFRGLLIALALFLAQPGRADSCLDLIARPQVSDAELVEKAQAAALAFLAKQGPLRTPEQEGFGGGKVRVDTYGVPSWIKPMAATSGRVFRHYLGYRRVGGESFDPASVLSSVRSSGRLVAGPTPYVKSDYPPRWYKETFHDLTGIFLTTPELEAEKVGVFGSPWVDVELLPGVAIFEIEPGRIFLIPGAPNELVVPFKIVGHSPLSP